MILFRLESDGGFIVGDTESRAAAYAYPTSENANLARTMPATIAAAMVKSANRFHHAMRDHVGEPCLAEFYARLWQRLNVFEETTP